MWYYLTPCYNLLIVINIAVGWGAQADLNFKYAVGGHVELTALTQQTLTIG